MRDGHYEILNKQEKRNPAALHYRVVRLSNGNDERSD